jgi:predicted PurR-regulated permease PerM
VAADNHSGAREAAEAPARLAAPPPAARRSDRDVVLLVAKSTAAALGIAALALGLWHVRSMVILLLLALTFAAAIRPGVEWLHSRGVPESVAILCFFLGVGAIFGLFFWLAVPPAVHQVQQALSHPEETGAAVRHSTGIRHDVLLWLDTHLRQLPSGTAIFHPVAQYGHKATDAVVAILFTLAATWYWVSERDTAIRLLTALAPEGKRERATETYLAIDRRLGSYTRLKFVMTFAVGVVLSAGFYLVGLNYWLLVGGFVALAEMIPVIGPVIGAILVVAVGLPQSLHTAALGLLVLVGVREFQSYVVNPHVMGHSVGLSPLVTLVSVSAVGLLFGPFAVVLAIPAMSAVATLIDVFVLDHEPPAAAAPPRRAALGRGRAG